jgi:hypothetical protein
MSEAGMVAKEGEITRRINNLGDSITTLGDRVSSMGGRLSSITTSPNPPSEKVDARAAAATEIGETLANMTDRIEGASAQLMDIMDRLEI